MNTTETRTWQRGKLAGKKTARSSTFTLRPQEVKTVEQVVKPEHHSFSNALQTNIERHERTILEEERQHYGNHNQPN